MILRIAFLVSCVFLSPPLLWAAGTQPNIVAIMTDNQGYGDLGIYGGLRAPTPRLDQLGSEGVVFQDFQVEPNCTPSRAAFMTGRMPIRSGTDGLVMPGQPGGLDPMEVTLAEVLKGAGYATAYYGKWHLGESAEHEPQMQGFDHWYGIHNTSLPVDPDFPGTDMKLIKPQKVVEGRAGKPAKVVRDMDISYRPLVDRDLTKMSVQFVIESGAKKDAPFFLMTSFINPHHPVVPHPDFKGKSGGGAYPDVLMEIDHNVGQILDAIDKAGIRNNTLVFFFSDNGPTRYSRQPDQNGDNGIWSGELGSAWEGGLRTIGMVRWPGKIAKGWKATDMIHVMDMYTTLGKIGGGNIPSDRPIDGVDQTNWLLGKQEHSARESRLVFFNGNFVGIRWRQFKFLTIEYEKQGSLSRPAYTGISLPQLYNLKSDPKEEYNIMGESGASNVGAFMLKMGVAAQASFKEFPNKDYSKMTRDK
ncbi:MAG: sulfatase-like hydrolase/transferase [Nitrospirales bacterium]